MPKNPPHVSRRRAVSARGTLLAAFGPQAALRPGSASSGAGGRARWIALDLRAVCDVWSVAVVFDGVGSGGPGGRGGAYPAVHVETSADGVVWRAARDVADGAAREGAEGTNAAPAVLFDEPVGARWVRVTPLTRPGSAAARLAGVRVYGTSEHERPPAVGWTAWAARPLTEDAEDTENGCDGGSESARSWAWAPAAAGWDLVLDDRAGAVAGAVVSAVDAGQDGRLPAAAPGTELCARPEERLPARPARGAAGRRAWWYRRQFVLPAEALPATAGPGAGGLWLEVEGIGHAAELWLNGRRLGALPHPFARTSFDVSAAVRTAGGPRGPHALAVRLAPESHPAGPDRAGDGHPPLRCPDARTGGVAVAPSARTLAAELGPRIRLRASAGEAAPPRPVLGGGGFAAAGVAPGPAALLRVPAATAPALAPGRAWWPAEILRDAPGRAPGAGLPAAFVRAVEERLGASTSPEAFARKARLVDYECLRAVVEAGAGRPSAHRYGGAQEPAPAGWTDAGRFGARKAAEPLHVQADPVDGSVTVVNRTADPVRGAVVSAQVYDLGGRPVGGPVARTLDDVTPGAVHALTVPFARSLPAAHLLRLTLADAAGRTLSANDYWRYRTPTDLRALNGLPYVPLSLRTEPAGPAAVTAEVTNTGAAPAASVRLSLGGPDAGDADDNFLWLLPGESRTVTMSRAGGHGGPVPVVTAEGYNALRVTA
jgi:hypothetical protein